MINTSIIKPEVIHIDDLLEEIASGKLRIPKFQRPFVWEPSDMLDLFDSLYNGYPIGSLLLWETAEKITSGSKVGAIEIPDIEGDGVITYILDGQQRLATLYSCLKLAHDFPCSRDVAEWQWWIWFDLRKETFVHVKNEKPQPWFFPVRACYQTTDFLAQARHIEAECKKDALQLIEKAEHISQKLRSYKIAITRVKGSNLEHAVDIFSRLNRKGKKITPDQMVSALVYSENENHHSLAEYIDEILENLTPYHFNNINRMTIFRAIMAADNKKIYKSDWENIAKKMSPDTLSTAAKNAKASLQNAAAFMNTEIGLAGDQLLPYSNQFLLLNEFFRYSPTPARAEIDILKKWFWVSSLSDYLISMNTTQLNKALKDMQQFATHQNQDAFETNLRKHTIRTPLFPKEHSSLNSSRLRIFLIFMLTKHPLNTETGQPIDAYKILSENGKNAFAYIFPSSQLKTPHSSPANRILIDRVPQKSIIEQLLDIPTTLQEKILLSHGIPLAAYQALKDNDAELFITLRIEHLQEIEGQFLKTFGLC